MNLAEVTHVVEGVSEEGRGQTRADRNQGLIVEVLGSPRQGHCFYPENEKQLEGVGRRVPKFDSLLTVSLLRLEYRQERAETGRS